MKLTSPLNYLGRSLWPTGIGCETDIEMRRRRETEPKKLISFLKELRTLSCICYNLRVINKTLVTVIELQLLYRE